MSGIDPRGFRNGMIAAGLLVAAIYFGSGRLRHFDPALIAYTSASIFATFAIVYRYSVWLSKPPTNMYWIRGWQIFLRPRQLPRNLLFLAKALWNKIFLQTFIERRDRQRWAAHFLISWGCIVSCMVTFPLVFGWVHFEADSRDPLQYNAFLFGIKSGSFPSTSLIGWLTFHVLDFTAIAVIAGMVLAMRRRMTDRGAMAVQSFGMDFLPIILLFAVCVTGLMLTVSTMFLKGYSYSFLALIHAFSVIVTMLFMPFGKFFHIFQRPANLGVQFYKREGKESEQALCGRCGEKFASKMHVEDLKTVLDQLGLDQRLPNGGHYQEICPACRRKNLALNQLEAIGDTGFI